MWFFKIKLNQKQKDELGKTFLDTGKLVFLGTAAAYILPPLNQIQISVQVAEVGILVALIFLILGVMLLGERRTR